MPVSRLLLPCIMAIACLLSAIILHSGCEKGNGPVTTTVSLHNLSPTITGNANADATDNLFARQLNFTLFSINALRMAKADVNRDGLEDVFICGGNGNARALYLQLQNGLFMRSNASVFAANAITDVDCTFFDADGDNDADLYVCSSYNPLQPAFLQVFDRLYLNDGNGNFVLSSCQLPAASNLETHTCVTAADVDADGDIDLYIGVTATAGQYGYHPGGYLLQNDGNGIFTNSGGQDYTPLNVLGPVTDARFFDYDKDGRPDLILAFENMPVRILHNSQGKFVEENIPAPPNFTGGWNRLVLADINEDGYPDIVAGNQTLNTLCNEGSGLFMNTANVGGKKVQVISTYNGAKAGNWTIRTAATSFDTVYTVHASILVNDTRRGFALQVLPARAQFAGASPIVPAGFMMQ